MVRPAREHPRNPNVRRIGRKELRALFSEPLGAIRSVTLALPIARRLAPRLEPLARMLETIPILRTHLAAVLVKGGP